jgi:hypothetical protein
VELLYHKEVADGVRIHIIRGNASGEHGLPTPRSAAEIGELRMAEIGFV